MKGQNEIILNESTMIEALQEYFDKRFSVSQFKITSVRGGSGTIPVAFNVTTVEHSMEPKT